MAPPDRYCYPEKITSNIKIIYMVNTSGNFSIVLSGTSFPPILITTKFLKFLLSFPTVLYIEKEKEKKSGKRDKTKRVGNKAK